MRIFVLGGTGLIGRALMHALLARGDQVRLLTRSAAKGHALFGTDLEVIEGDPLHEGPWTQALAGSDAVVNLVGEPIADKPWTDQQLARIRSSRIESTRILVQSISKLDAPPRALVQGTAVGYYGSRGDERLEESSAPGTDKIAQLCVEWELEALKARAAGVRVVALRTGVVLASEGGALEKMLLPFKLFVGGSLGDGQQFFPWIHLEDLVGLMIFCLDREDAAGPLNGAAPEGLRMSTFCRVLGATLGRPSWLPVPRFALKLLMGERADMILASQRVVPARSLELGYVFRYPKLEPALRALLGS